MIRVDRTFGAVAFVLGAALAAGCSSDSKPTGEQEAGPDATGDTASQDVASQDVASQDSTIDAGLDATPDTSISETWRHIPAGTFQMGSAGDDSCRDKDALQHQVTLTNDFELQSTEVTQAQFASLMGYNPSVFSASGSQAACAEDCPVDNVSWYEAAAYCNALSIEAGLATCYDCSGSGADVVCDSKSNYADSAIYGCRGYRLPTESEWEYAYRAGTETAYYSGSEDASQCGECATIHANLDRIGWYCANSGDTTHPVAQKEPNAWGLYDMAGNVWEWCHEWHGPYPAGGVENPATGSGDFRVIRGGAYHFAPYFARADFRFFSTPENRDSYFGFRCARTITP